MATYIIGYSLILFVVLFVVFSILVKKKILFGNTYAIQRIFGAPLLHYSIRRIGSALVSVSLAILVTFFLVRVAQPAHNSCIKLFATPHTPAGSAVFNLKCDNWKEMMGMSGSTLYQLARFFYSILPFPKTVCLSDYDASIGAFLVTDCRNFVIDLGRIYDIKGVANGTLVIDYMSQRMAVSFSYGIWAVLLELGLGYPFGLLMAKYQNRAFDKIGKAYIISIDAIPGVAYYFMWMALLVGVLKLNQVFNNMVPAVLTMGFTGMAGIGLWVRRYMVDEFNSDYVKFARSKGLSENRIMGIHVLRNAVVPLARTFPSAVIGALMGSYFIENIYSINGIGKALMVAAGTGSTCNAWLLQGIIIVSAYLSIISYLLGDIVTACVDPRISFTK